MASLQAAHKPCSERGHLSDIATRKRHKQGDCRTTASVAGCASEKSAWADTASGRHAGAITAEVSPAQGVHPEGKSCGTPVSARPVSAACRISADQCSSRTVSSQPPTVSMTGVLDGPRDYTSAFELCQPLLRPKALKLAPFPASPEAQEASRRLLALVPGAGLHPAPPVAACWELYTAFID